MNRAEANALVSILVAHFPGSRFTPDNAAAYEKEFAKLDANEAREAIEQLVGEAPHLPPIAAIRAEITRQKRERVRVEEAGRLRITDGHGRSAGPAPHVWGVTLARMLEEQARARKADADFRKQRGLEPRVWTDPGQKFLDIAAAGARGQDVSEMTAREGWGT